MTSKRACLSGSSRSAGARRGREAAPPQRSTDEVASPPASSRPRSLLYSVFIVYPLLSALADSFWRLGGHRARRASPGWTNFTGLFTTFPLEHTSLAGVLAHRRVLRRDDDRAEHLRAARRRAAARAAATKRFLQTVYTLPYLIGGLVVGYLWSLLLEPGVRAGEPVAGRGRARARSRRPWLGDPTTALPVVILVNAWHYIGFPILLFGAALAGIPAEYSEAARVDGANAVAAVLPGHPAAAAAGDRRRVDPDVHRLLQRLRARLRAGRRAGQPAHRAGRRHRCARPASSTGSRSRRAASTRSVSPPRSRCCCSSSSSASLCWPTATSRRRRPR